MSLSATLNVGRSGLVANQAALQTVGNNIANVGNPDYARQVVHMSAVKDQEIRPGIFVGRGVEIDGIHRQIDEALDGRVRNSLSDKESADAQSKWLSRIESVFNELSDEDLSTQLSKFFNSWSDLANKPQEVALRQVVLEYGAGVASWFKQMNGQMGSLREELNDSLRGTAIKANDLAGKIANVNTQIVAAEGGRFGAEANGLRDTRDGYLKELASITDIRTNEQKNGVVNVYIGSDPLVFDGRSRGVTAVNDSADGTVFTKIVFKENGGELRAKAGSLGGLLGVRDAVDSTTSRIDGLANSLSFELNKVHSGGQGLDGYSTVIGTTTVSDATVPLSDPKSGLKQFPNNGSFVIHVKDKATGLASSDLVQVDLDGTGPQMSLDDLIARIDAVDGVTAVNNGGRLQITADNTAGTEITFSQDSSGVLAALGVNNFFTGTDARSIAVNANLRDNPRLLAAAKNGASGDNQTARAIANLETTPVKSLNGQTIRNTYEQAVDAIATQSSAAVSSAQASAAVLETLEAHRQTISGVSLDEEALNLMKYQRAYQGAARLISVVDELMDTLMGIVR